MKFYSPTTFGFYAEEIHGERFLLIPDPDFENPQKAVIDPDWDAPDGFEGEHPFILVDDLDIAPKSISIPNPDCGMPADVIEVAEDAYSALLAQQAFGKSIQPGPDGFPIACEQPPPSEDAIRRERSARIAATDWTQLSDIPAATKAAWKVYRQALRDVSEQPGFPADVAWPTAPA